VELAASPASLDLLAKRYLRDSLARSGASSTSRSSGTVFPQVRGLASDSETKLELRALRGPFLLGPLLWPGAQLLPV
jgi:hypothetical protein